MHKLRVEYPREPYRIYSLADWIARETTYCRPALLWITEWGIWASSENLHLYYTLRQAAGDHQLLEEAPGHLFLNHELPELASFIQVAMLNGWGGYILTDMNYINAFFSHDEYVDFFAAEGTNIAVVRAGLSELLKPGMKK